VAADRVAHVLRVSATRGTCRGPRPVRCRLGNLQPGQAVTIRARTRVLVPGRLQSVIFASGTSPETNTTNNQGVAGLRVTPARLRLRVRVAAPAFGRVGTALSYRVSVTPSRGARAVRLCARVPASFTGATAAGAVRRGGSLCRTFARVAAGATAGFAVRAVPAAGGPIALPAVARAPGAARARGTGRARVGVVACAATAGRPRC
jgi:hypothetical protein